MIKFEQSKKLKPFLLTSISIVWFFLGLFFIISDFKNNYKNYKAIANCSLNDKRAFISGWDYYQFLMFCDKIIPKGKDIKWVLLRGGFLGNDEYFFFKAYYYLYPRNYRDNADYIIVYGRENYKPPSNYRIFAVYETRGYILKK